MVFNLQKKKKKNCCDFNLSCFLFLFIFSGGFGDLTNFVSQIVPSCIGEFHRELSSFLIGTEPKQAVGLSRAPTNGPEPVRFH